MVSPAPESQFAWLVGWWDEGVSVCPEPAINIQGLQMRSVTALVSEVTLSARSVSRGDIIWKSYKGQTILTIMHHGGEMSVLVRGLKAD